MPSADIRSNRCVPLRGTSAGYASASSAFIKFLKSGAGRRPFAVAVCRCDGVNISELILFVNKHAYKFSRGR